VPSSSSGKVDSVANVVYDTVQQKSNDRKILGMTEKFSAKEDFNDRLMTVILSCPLSLLR
jgi:hypothetical protein